MIGHYAIGNESVPVKRRMTGFPQELDMRPDTVGAALVAADSGRVELCFWDRAPIVA